MPDGTSDESELQMLREQVAHLQEQLKLTKIECLEARLALMEATMASIRDKYPAVQQLLRELKGA